MQRGRLAAAEVEARPEIDEMHAIMRAVQRHPAADPAEGGVWASTVECDAFWAAYPGFAGEFHAGGLRGRDRAWAEVFEEEGVHLPARLMRWLREGYWVWVDHAKMRKQPKALRLSREELQWAEAHVRDVLLPIGAVEEVNREALRPSTVVCNVVIAYKDGQMSRMCWSGKPINEGLRKKKFRMEAWADIAAMAEPGDWAFSLDLEKGYLQFGLAQPMKDFCVFQVGDRVYRYRVMPFGLASAPRDFSFAVKRVVAIFRARGFRVSFYIDDLIFLARSQREALAMRQQVLRILHRLGLRVSRKKSLLQPGQLLPHLGLELDLRDCRLYVPEKKVMIFKSLARELLECHGDVEGRTVARVVGKLMSFRCACPAVVVFARGLMRSLAQLPLKRDRRQGEEVARGVFQWRDYTGRVSMSRLAVVELRFWLQNIFRLRSARLGKRIEVVSILGSGDSRGGAIVGCLQGQGPRGRLQVEEVLHGVREGPRSGEATAEVMKQILALLGTHGEQWRGKRVHVCTGVAGAASALGKGAMWASGVHAWVLRVWGIALEYDMEVSAQYLAVDGIVLPSGEGLSCSAGLHDCMLRRDVFERVWQWKGPFDVDCCGSLGAVQRDQDGLELPTVSPYLRSALWSDVLSFVHHGRLYAFPPGAIIQDLLCHVMREGLRMVVILPWWPTQPWFPRILQCEVLFLGDVEQVVHAGSAGERHPFGQQFDLQNTRVRMLAVAFNM